MNKKVFILMFPFFSILFNAIPLYSLTPFTEKFLENLNGYLDKSTPPFPQNLKEWIIKEKPNPDTIIQFIDTALRFYQELLPKFKLVNNLETSTDLKKDRRYTRLYDYFYIDEYLKEAGLYDKVLKGFNEGTRYTGGVNLIVWLKAKITTEDAKLQDIEYIQWFEQALEGMDIKYANEDIGKIEGLRSVTNLILDRLKNTVIARNNQRVINAQDALETFYRLPHYNTFTSSTTSKEMSQEDQIKFVKTFVESTTEIYQQLLYNLETKNPLTPGVASFCSSAQINITRYRQAIVETLQKDERLHAQVKAALEPQMIKLGTDLVCKESTPAAFGAALRVLNFCKDALYKKDEPLPDELQIPLRFAYTGLAHKKFQPLTSGVKKDYLLSTPTDEDVDKELFKQFENAYPRAVAAPPNPEPEKGKPQPEPEPKKHPVKPSLPEPTPEPTTTPSLLTTHQKTLLGVGAVGIAALTMSQRKILKEALEHWWYVTLGHHKKLTPPLLEHEAHQLAQWIDLRNMKLVEMSQYLKQEWIIVRKYDREDRELIKKQAEKLAAKWYK